MSISSAIHRRDILRWLSQIYSFVAFPFVDVDNGCVLELLRNSPVQLYNALRQVYAPRTCKFRQQLHLVLLLFHWKVSSMSGRCAMLSIAACDIVDGLFSTSLKCSAHRSRMRLGYVSRISVSALNIDEDPFACGPYIAVRPS